jgi:hypothetical protein
MTVDGVLDIWIFGFIDHLHVVTTNIYNTTDDLHALQFTRAHSLAFSVCY